MIYDLRFMICQAEESLGRSSCTECRPPLVVQRDSEGRNNGRRRKESECRQEGENGWPEEAERLRLGRRDEQIKYFPCVVIRQECRERYGGSQKQARSSCAQGDCFLAHEPIMGNRNGNHTGCKHGKDRPLDRERTRL